MTTAELRSLDTWLAEHVMGWEWWRFKACGEKWCQLVPPDEKWPWRRGFDGIKCKCAIAALEDRTDLSMFAPTTDRAAAMEVLKKCAEKSYQISIVECLGDWAVTHGDGTDPTAPYSEAPYGEAKTLELAICLFARKLFPKL